MKADYSVIADTGFEKHPLENAIKSLRQSKPFHAYQLDNYDVHELQGIIYQDEVMIHFWNTSVEVSEIYKQRADDQKLLTLGWAAELERLHSETINSKLP